MSFRSLLLVCAILVVPCIAYLSGCGDDGTGAAGECPDCQYWTRLTTDGGQFPAAHPSRAGVIAYASRRADPTGENADIWIREETGGDTLYHRVTSDPGDERLPSWSPDGTRLAFSRFADGRYDIWIVDVTSFSNPTDLRRLTAPEMVAGFPGRSTWRDDQTLIFTNGDDIYELSLTAGRLQNLVELVPDPADEILGLGLKFKESQPSYYGSELAERLAFISEGRGPQGNIQVTAFAETGEPITAIISVDQKPLLNPDRDTLRTPFNLFGIAPGQYVVGVTATGGQDALCDTSLSMRVLVRSNEVEQAEFIFERPRGAIRILAPTGFNERILIQDSRGGIRDLGELVADTTLVGCLFPGVYNVQYLSGTQLKDSVSVEVCERKVSQVCLSPVLGGCPDSLTIPCVDTLIYVPAVAPEGEGGASWAPSGKAPAAIGAAQDISDLWVYDFIENDFLRLTTDAANQDVPSWSPDGRYIAFIENDLGRRRLVIVEPDTREFRTVPLPGRPTTVNCNRTVGPPSWMPGGDRIVVGLTNCDDEIESAESFDLWVVDVGEFLP